MTHSRASVASLLGIALLVAWPLVFGSAYDLRLFALAGITAINVIGYHVVFGHAGALALTQGTFFGLGAYVTGLAALDFGWSSAVTLPLSMVVPVALAWLIAIPVLRLASHYFALATLGIGQVMLLVAIQWESLTGGANGRPGVPGVVLFDTPVPRGWPLVLFVWSLVAVVGLVTWRYTRGLRGRAFAVMRGDELAAHSIGIDIGRLREQAFLWSAALGGLSGALYVHTVRVISPEVLEFHVMVAVLTMAVVGGRLHIAGAIAGAFLLTHLPEWLRGFDRHYLIVYGLALLAAIIVLPDGLWGWIHRRRVHAVPAVPAPSGGTVQAPPIVRSGISSRPLAGDEVLQVVGMGIAFGGVKALDDVSLVVRAGEVLGLIGPNGSGKTTLVNCLSRLYRPSTGTIVLRGRDVTRLAPHEIARAGIARTFQHLHLIDDLSVIDNVAVARFGVPRCRDRHVFARKRSDLATARAEVMPYLELVGLAPHAEDRAGDLPYGRRRAIEIARALALAPAALLLDEPTAGLNAAEQHALAQVIAAIAASGIAVIVIEHNMPFLMPLTHRIVCLEQGRVIATGTPAQIRVDPGVVRAYLGVDDGTSA